MKSSDLIQWRGMKSRSMASLHMMTLYFGAGALGSEMAIGMVHPATDEHWDRDAQHCPRGWGWKGMERDLSPVPGRGDDFIITVKPIRIFNTFLDFNKSVHQNAELKALMSHLPVYQSTVTLKVLGHFPERINTYRTKLLVLGSLGLGYSN